MIPAQFDGPLFFLTFQSSYLFRSDANPTITAKIYNAMPVLSPTAAYSSIETNAPKVALTVVVFSMSPTVARIPINGNKAPSPYGT